KTTQAKAKAVKPEVEQLITLAKRGDLHARRQALSALGQDKFAVHKLFDEVAPRYAQRPGGYTRILKLGPRRSDATEMVFLALVGAQRPAGAGCLGARGRAGAPGFRRPQGRDVADLLLPPRHAPRAQRIPCADRPALALPARPRGAARMCVRTRRHPRFHRVH